MSGRIFETILLIKNKREQWTFYLDVCNSEWFRARCLTRLTRILPLLNLAHFRGYLLDNLKKSCKTT